LWGPERVPGELVTVQDECCKKPGVLHPMVLVISDAVQQGKRHPVDRG
jgi:hypothetical protein